MQRAPLKNLLAVRLHPNLADLYQRKVAALQDLLESDATRTETVEIIRSLVDQVIFRPPPRQVFRSNSWATSPGWSIWPKTQKTAPFPGLFNASSVKVVAGPTTTFTELGWNGRVFGRTSAV